MPLLWLAQLGWLSMVTLGTVVAITPSTADPVKEDPGALPAWISTDPVVAEARALVEQGKWAKAEAALHQSSSADDVDAASTRREMLEIVTRLRWDYGQDAPSLLHRIRATMPDTTLADIDRWRREGVLQWREVDGAIAYFRREPANLFRFCEEAKQQAPAAQVAAAEAEKAAIREHMAQVVAAAERNAADEVLPLRHRVRFTLTVPPTATGIKPGALVRAWLPFPQEYRQQKDVRLISASPGDAKIAPVAQGESPLRGNPQRTVYLEHRVGQSTQPVTFAIEFEFTAFAYYPRLDDAAARPLPANYADGSLVERPPHIRFTPEVQKLAKEITRGQENPLSRAREIFRWVHAHIVYAAEQEYCLIPSLSTKALATRRGDCGVQTMIFITLCRAAGVPARWQSGWTLGPAGQDMHDWAEFYVAPWGWVPADPSRGYQKSEQPEVRDFYFGHQDAYRLIINRDYGSPLQPPKLSSRSEPLDFQRGEVEVDGVNLYFNEWNYEMRVESGSATGERTG